MTEWINNFSGVHDEEENANDVKEENAKNDVVLVTILAKDKAHCLPVYLRCLELQTWPKSKTLLYIRTNNNTDNTKEMLENWVNKLKTEGEYKSIYFNANDIPERVQDYKHHEWNNVRLVALSKIRQESITYALERGAHYFTADCDVFFIPETLKNLMITGFQAIGPLITNSSSFANIFHRCDKNGYLDLYNPREIDIVSLRVSGLIEVDLVHCVYLYRNNILKDVIYNDHSGRYEFIIVADHLRKKKIPQYIDTRYDYGRITEAVDSKTLHTKPWWPCFEFAFPNNNNELNKMMKHNPQNQILTLKIKHGLEKKDGEQNKIDKKDGKTKEKEEQAKNNQEKKEENKEEEGKKKKEEKEGEEKDGEEKDGEGEDGEGEDGEGEDGEGEDGEGEDGEGEDGEAEDGEEETGEKKDGEKKNNNEKDDDEEDGEGEDEKEEDGEEEDKKEEEEEADGEGDDGEEDDGKEDGEENDREKTAQDNKKVSTNSNTSNKNININVNKDQTKTKKNNYGFLKITFGPKNGLRRDVTKVICGLYYNNGLLKIDAETKLVNILGDCRWNVAKVLNVYIGTSLIQSINEKVSTTFKLYVSLCNINSAYSISNQLTNLKTNEKAKTISKFTQMQNNNKGNGPGSTLDATVLYRQLIERFLVEKNISTVLDIGCGDWDYCQHINWGLSKYTGLDCVESIIEFEKKTFTKENIQFMLSDVFTEPLTQNYDLIILKDVIQHWPLSRILQMLPIFRAHAKYLLVTNCCHQSSQATEIQLGEWQQLSRTMVPLSLFAPELVLKFGTKETLLILGEMRAVKKKKQSIKKNI
jgi:SAM-dependent methyltransferase